MAIKGINTEKAPGKGFIPFITQAICVGNLVFTSGVGPRDPKTLRVPEDFEEQCRNAFENLKAIAEASGTSLKNAVKVTCYITDMKNWETMNKIYLEYFTGDPMPARTTIEVSRLGGKDPYKIEIEAILYIPQSTHR